MLLVMIKCEIFSKSRKKNYIGFLNFLASSLILLMLNVALRVPRKYLITPDVSKKLLYDIGSTSLEKNTKLSIFISLQIGDVLILRGG